MAVPFSQIDKTTHDEMSCTFAALILYDEGLEISGEKINKLIAASGNKVDAYWPGLFARALQGKNVAELLLGGAGSAGPVSSGGAPGKEDAKKADTKEAAKKDDKKEAKKETKKEEPKPVEDDLDMGGGMDIFGDF